MRPLPRGRSHRALTGPRGRRTGAMGRSPRARTVTQLCTRAPISSSTSGTALSEALSQPVGGGVGIMRGRVTLGGEGAEHCTQVIEVDRLDAIANVGRALDDMLLWPLSKPLQLLILQRLSHLQNGARMQVGTHRQSKRARGRQGAARGDGAGSSTPWSRAATHGSLPASR